MVEDIWGQWYHKRFYTKLFDWNEMNLHALLLFVSAIRIEARLKTNIVSQTHQMLKTTQEMDYIRNKDPKPSVY